MKQKIPHWIKTVVYVVLLVFSKENGFMGLFLIISTLILCLVYKRQLWAYMQSGSDVFVKKSEDIGEKLEKVVNNVRR